MDSSQQDIFSLCTGFFFSFFFIISMKYNRWICRQIFMYWLCGLCRRHRFFNTYLCPTFEHTWDSPFFPFPPRYIQYIYPGEKKNNLLREDVAEERQSNGKNTESLTLWQNSYGQTMKLLTGYFIYFREEFYTLFQEKISDNCC